MRIQIFVVKTEMPDAQLLEYLRKSLLEMFHGLTIIPKATGYWVNDKGKEDKDKVEIWEIFTNEQGYNQEMFTDIMMKMKTLTNQSVQAVGINNDIVSYGDKEMLEFFKEHPIEIPIRLLVTIQKNEEILGKDFRKDLFEEEVKK
jgi:hypothetical protein